MLGKCLVPDEKSVLPHHCNKIPMKIVTMLETGALAVFPSTNKSSNRLSDSFNLQKIRTFSQSLLEEYHLYLIYSIHLGSFKTLKKHSPGY